MDFLVCSINKCLFTKRYVRELSFPHTLSGFASSSSCHLQNQGDYYDVRHCVGMDYCSVLVACSGRARPSTRASSRFSLRARLRRAFVSALSPSRFRRSVTLRLLALSPSSVFNLSTTLCSALASSFAIAASNSAFETFAANWVTVAA